MGVSSTLRRGRCKEKNLDRTTVSKYIKVEKTHGKKRKGTKRIGRKRKATML